jgi:hypothetical protein
MVVVGFAASGGGSDDGTQLQGDPESDLGGEECHHGTEGSVHGFVGDDR